jgi:Pentapeptide repeats (8 copies)
VSTLFKVLSAEGEACHGGNGKWPLPKGKRPGAWHEVKGAPKVCLRGLHLVTEPLAWWKEGARLFEAEPDLTQPASFDGSHKAAFSRARLIREVTPDWPLLGMFPNVRVFLAQTLKSNGDEEGAKKLLANLAGANLAGANLARAYLARAYLAGAYLARAPTSHAPTSHAPTSQAPTSHAPTSQAPTDRRTTSLAGLPTSLDCW